MLFFNTKFLWDKFLARAVNKKGGCFSARGEKNTHLLWGEERGLPHKSGGEEREERAHHFLGGEVTKGEEGGQ